ncbi:uncharacterized protein F4807DRAFT_461476 [Annulohypoxylon truncatum]|uniref:uncharacterized protein n=1 Tax=Annulohypoxylon truncatum TaxID=327061 RepID=UPI002007F042|nr:uncharacterized protein F4807DRAFT_461476 [Annulohypoxylon truncatum]KAI1208543.1 hypothetical protein F4807DRAFT_461476 [Annulohypoxylon truncatum]
MRRTIRRVSAKPIIFQFSLGEERYQKAVDIRETRQQIDYTATIRKLAENRTPHAILLTDFSIAEPKNFMLLLKVIRYAREGGIVVLSVCFAFTMHFDRFDQFMKEWGLPWAIHGEHCHRCILNPSAVGPNTRWKSGLPNIYGFCQFNMVYLKNVSPESCWYLPEPPRSYGFDGDNKWQPLGRETPVAFSRVGKGYLGFTGDVDQEEATDAVLFSMLGLNLPLSTEWIFKEEGFKSWY